ncbi:MAG TPA: RNA polymerase sigma factor [Micromonosporaceae bacterium]|nr:RNA polymerase sigma factor [Micromonosporaceae bacterium]
MADDEAQEAIREAYQAYYRRLVATLYGLTADYAEAQDLVQEAYARALARPKTFLDVADPEAWLRTVAVNLARTRWRRRRLLDTMIRTGRVTPTPESVPGADPTRVLLVAALSKLSRPTRETIVLHHIADMSVQEVAEQLGIPVGTVKARLSRGRAVLAELLHDGAPTLATGRSPQTSAINGRRPARAVPARGAGILPVEANGVPVGPAGHRVDDLVAPAADLDIDSWSADVPVAMGRSDDLPHQRTAADRIGADRPEERGPVEGLDRLLGDTTQPAESLVSVRGRRR